eukprot:g18480.t1
MSSISDEKSDSNVDETVPTDAPLVPGADGSGNKDKDEAEDTPGLPTQSSGAKSVTDKAMEAAAKAAAAVTLAAAVAPKSDASAAGSATGAAGSNKQPALSVGAPVPAGAPTSDRLTNGRFAPGRTFRRRPEKKDYITDPRQRKTKIRELLRTGEGKDPGSLIKSLKKHSAKLGVQFWLFFADDVKEEGIYVGEGPNKHADPDYVPVELFKEQIRAARAPDPSVMVPVSNQPSVVPVIMSKGGEYNQLRDQYRSGMLAYLKAIGKVTPNARTCGWREITNKPDELPSRLWQEKFPQLKQAAREMLAWIDVNKAMLNVLKVEAKWSDPAARPGDFPADFWKPWESYPNPAALRAFFNAANDWLVEHGGTALKEKTLNYDPNSSSQTPSKRRRSRNTEQQVVNAVNAASSPAALFSTIFSTLYGSSAAAAAAAAQASQAGTGAAVGVAPGLAALRSPPPLPSSEQTAAVSSSSAASSSAPATPTATSTSTTTTVASSTSGATPPVVATAVSAAAAAPRPNAPVTQPAASGTPAGTTSTSTAFTAVGGKKQRRRRARNEDADGEASAKKARTGSDEAQGENTEGEAKKGKGKGKRGREAEEGGEEETAPAEGGDFGLANTAQLAKERLARQSRDVIVTDA